MMKNLSNYMNKDLVLFLNSGSRNEAIQSLVDAIHSVHGLSDPSGFYQAILDREKLVSTGIGMGVSLPHAKMADYNSFFIAIGILNKGVDWNAIDHSPVRLIFMIGGPDDKQTEYLQILSRLTLLIKKEEIRKKMLTLNSQEAIIELFKGQEGPLFKGA